MNWHCHCDQRLHNKKCCELLYSQVHLVLVRHPILPQLVTSLYYFMDPILWTYLHSFKALPHVSNEKPTSISISLYITSLVHLQSGKQPPPRRVARKLCANHIVHASISGATKAPPMKHIIYRIEFMKDCSFILPWLDRCAAGGCCGVIILCEGERDR